jgi:serine/threonine-protein kinase
MGTVYRIEHEISKRVEAMKVLPGGLGSDPEQVQRFEREIQVQARLHHPNIAALYTAVRDESSIALIMEFVEGESLQRMLEAGPLPISTAVDFISQVLSALAYAHAADVIHRDVAPANIIITHNRIAKLTDFGLARATTDRRLTISGAPLGSPWYMSPEQVRNLDFVDTRSDIYSTGAVLYEMVTGCKPFQGESSFVVMRAHVEAAPAPPSTHNPEIPAALDGIILKALSKDPAQRFQSADEFRVALRQALPAYSTVITPPSAPRAAVAPVEPKRSRRQFAAMIVAPVAFVAGFGAVALTRAPRPRPVAHPAPIVSSVPAPTPAPVAVAEPVPSVLPEPKPEVPAAPASSTPAAHTAARRARQASAPAIRVTGGEVQSASTGAAPSRTAAPAPVTVLPDPPTPQPEPVVAPPPPDALPAAADAAPAPPKPGNRLVRALGKINPFKKKTTDSGK